MDVQEAIETGNPEDGAKSRLNAWVAVSVALIATLMALCNVKDGNIVQAMQQAQADKLDHWAWYQAHKERITIDESTLTQLKLAPDTPAVREERSKWEAALAKQSKELDDVKNQAEADQKTYDDWNYRDDQFDASESALSLGIALMAVTSLTQKRWLYVVAIIPGLFGAVMGLAGLFGWPIHPDLLAKWLGT